MIQLLEDCFLLSHDMIQLLEDGFPPVMQSWESAGDRYQEKLLNLIGKIGKDDRSGKTASKVSGPVCVVM